MDHFSSRSVWYLKLLSLPQTLFDRLKSTMSKKKSKTKALDSEEAVNERYAMQDLLVKIAAKQQAAIDQRIAENAADSAAASSSSSAESKAAADGSFTLNNQQCRVNGCKKKCKPGCVHQMCFTCCYEQPVNGTIIVCSAHFRERMKKDEEERYFEEGFARAHTKRKTNFYHYEDRFHNFGDTVVVWCQKDFNRSKRASKDVLDQNTREIQSRLLKRKREQARLLMLAGGGSSSSSSSSGAAAAAGDNGQSSLGHKNRNSSSSSSSSSNDYYYKVTQVVKGNDTGILGRGPKALARWAKVKAKWGL